MAYFRRLLLDTRESLARNPDLVIIGVIATLALLATQLHVPALLRLLAARIPGPHATAWAQLLTKLIQTVVLPLLPLASAPLLGIRLKDLGLDWGRPSIWLRNILVLFLLMLPLVWLASRQPAFRRVYPYFAISRLGPGCFLLGLATRLGYMLSWEFMFRGYLLFGFERRVGPAAAIAVSTIPFVLMHVGKPALEAYGSVLAGIALGIVALRGRSFIPAAILHFAVAASLELAALIP